jgi:hypothetical protein
MSGSKLAGDSFKFKKRRQHFIGARNETLSVVAMCVSNEYGLSGTIHEQRWFLEQPEDFEDNHNNDNNSDYVKDVSVHAGDSYQSECAVAIIIQTERLPESFLVTWIRMQCEWAMQSFSAGRTMPWFAFTMTRAMWSKRTSIRASSKEWWSFHSHRVAVPTKNFP